MLKRYGTNKNSFYIFSKKYGLNIRNSNISVISSKTISLFNQSLRSKITGRQLFEYTKLNIAFLKTIKSYRGLRHKNRYPVRGQRTHTNATKKNFKFPQI